ncbi:MAG: hypothetical protein PHS38_15490, partial [Bacteroidales bacterium]|nr:hypothetical protein [Bacteroidales bacterium]
MRNIKKYLLVCAAMLSAVSIIAQHKTYFVTPSGDDSASGLSVKEAWKSLDKVSRTIFQPGDRILLESGGEWFGRLELQGSGSAEEPVILSSFGGSSLPVINLGKLEGAAVLLHNNGGWEISNLEITSMAPPEVGKTRLGIYVNVDQEGLNVAHVVIKNCFIH